MEFSFFSNPNQAVSVNDLLTTMGALLAMVIAWRQKIKDEQIKSRDETIAFLKQQIEYLQQQLKNKL